MLDPCHDHPIPNEDGSFWGCPHETLRISPDISFNQPTYRDGDKKKGCLFLPKSPGIDRIISWIEKPISDGAVTPKILWNCVFQKIALMWVKQEWNTRLGMVYTIYLWWGGEWVTIVLPTLSLVHYFLSLARLPTQIKRQDDHILHHLVDVSIVFLPC